MTAGATRGTAAVSSRNTRRQTAARGSRPRPCRGQALIEFTMFFILTLVLIAGVVNIGGLLTDHLNIEYAARQGARTAAVLGNQALADCAIIGAIDNALLGMPDLQLDEIVMYRADAAGLSQGSSSETIYPGNTTCAITGGVPSLSQPPTLNNYPPANRQNQPYTEDSIGVELQYTYTFQFPLLGNGTFSAADHAVMPISPLTVPTPGG
jgi:Flp pilus assembly protein TadG